MKALLLLLLVVSARADSPHDRPDACLTCHVAGPRGKVGAPKPSIATCSGCHADAARDMHAVGVLPSAEIPVPAGWPLEDGKIACATCHAEPSCDAGRSDQPPFHRGAPYVEAQGLCWQCHARAEFGRSDPHHDDTCVACHVETPAEGHPALRLPGDELCAFCHESRHAGTEEHLGQAAATTLPLHDGRVACFTCHDVHDAPAPLEPVRRPGGDAVRAIAWEDLERITPRPGHPPLLALPLDDGALCGACHAELP